MSDQPTSPDPEHIVRVTKKQGEPLEGRVAQLVNERELIINLGKENGVEPGMRFSVLTKEPFIVSDPETGEELGRWEQTKTKVQATIILPRMTICRTYSYKMKGGVMFALQQDLFEPRTKVYETLRASSGSFPAPLSPEDSYVEIGDRVREIVVTKGEEE